jgi:hypothetical protein
MLHELIVKISAFGGVGDCHHVHYLSSAGKHHLLIINVVTSITAEDNQERARRL